MAKPFLVHTVSRVGWIYEVNARTAKEARKIFENGGFVTEYIDTSWSGDSEEETYKVTKK